MNKIISRPTIFVVPYHCFSGLTSKYSYVRFRWIPADLEQLAEIIDEFLIEKRTMPTSINDLSPYRKYRELLVLRSDTLTVLASPFRAIMSQKDDLPFTKRDLNLRDIILREYPKKSSTFFPWGFSKEPSFRTEQ